MGTVDDIGSYWNMRSETYSNANLEELGDRKSVV